MERGSYSVDGSVFEGGGQLLRISLCISGLTCTPLSMRNIRVGRPKPGLARSHLAALKTFAKITSARLDSVKVGTREFNFYPKALRPGHYVAECETAGSCALMFQCLFPVLMRVGATATIKGGTDVHFSPPTFFIRNVLKPTLSLMGIEFDYQVTEYGFEPSGGGEVQVTATECPVIRPLVLLEKGTVESVTGEVLLARGRGKPGLTVLDRSFGETVVASVSGQLGLPNVQIEVKEVQDFSRCAVVSLVARTTSGCLIHASAIENSKQIDPSRLATEVAQKLLQELAGDYTVDSHIQDQTVLFMALATGTSSVKTQELTEHTKGALYLVETLLGATTSYQDGVLTITGVGRQ